MNIPSSVQLSIYLFCLYACAERAVWDQSGWRILSTSCSCIQVLNLATNGREQRGNAVTERNSLWVLPAVEKDSQVISVWLTPPDIYSQGSIFSTQFKKVTSLNTTQMCAHKKVMWIDFGRHSFSGRSRVMHAKGPRWHLGVGWEKLFWDHGMCSQLLSLGTDTTIQVQRGT